MRARVGRRLTLPNVHRGRSVGHGGGVGGVEGGGGLGSGVEHVGAGGIGDAVMSSGHCVLQRTGVGNIAHIFMIVNTKFL